MTIASGNVVTLHYQVSSDDGTVLDSSKDKNPLTVLLGQRFLIEGLEEALMGKNEGDKFNVHIEPEKGYGKRSEQLVQKVPLNMFEGVDVEVGMSFRATTEQGEQSVMIVEKGDDYAVVDGNHPLADVPLNFDVEVVKIREATEEEKAHGHAHGEDGCGHSH
ncbi:FKBP-type peptidyl-prolyl cis-trans isomerase [Alteromonas ponticola]|uniref:Peptidyl-prolyl cis-trans isomerase n=1 Tax=Alteromonas ponticola TaxID=2720613 RepID=A0ABX1R164_9ALTE|nr:peptidylprolyl isomerase [Alteromonas ponticola]NMH58945.1 peptidylprolyl isomerase [Alteromonas ponticola]